MIDTLVKMYIFELSVFFLLLSTIRAECGPNESTTFEKYSGFRPERGEPVFIYTAGTEEPSVAGTCLHRCSSMDRCAGVAVTQTTGECVGYAHAANRTLRQDNDASFFIKTCKRLPAQCEGRWWSVENTAGYHLHAQGKDNRVILNVTSDECSRALVDPANYNKFRSAQWVSRSSLEELHPSGGEVASVSEEELGDCVVNTEDKYTEPESYRVASFRTVYKENQCRHDFPAKIERCSYEEYYNQTLKHIELSLREFSVDECKQWCERETRFVCRGFTWSPRVGRGAGEAQSGHCALHSEDILTIGSWLLKRAPASNYYRRVVCLNISVECTDSDMVVTYRPRGVFRGRVYVPGRGERCGRDAPGGNQPVRLTLPIDGPCDVNLAYAVTRGPHGAENKTMAYAMVMVQNNPIIQTAGDRWVRVGCAPDSAHARQSLTLDAALLVSVDSISASPPGEPGQASAGAQTAGAVPPSSAVFNTTPAPPPLAMYVMRAGPAPSERAVSLGELLELRVETTEENEMEVYHLVASSRMGESSVLLLDNRGCPTGQVDFPSFVRTRLGDENGRTIQRLTAKFKAFRFPNSHVVRFALMVRFCNERCEQVQCDAPEKAEQVRARSSRETNSTSSFENELASAVDEFAEVREDSRANWDGPTWNSRDEGDRTYVKKYVGGRVVAQSGAVGGVGCGGAGTDLFPLELEMMVSSRDLLTADTLVRGHHQPEIAESTMSGGGGGGVVCIHELLVVALVLVWLLVQLLLLIGCCVIVKRYRNFAEVSQKDYQSFDNVGFDTLSTHRRVHWPDQNVDILHIS